MSAKWRPFCIGLNVLICPYSDINWASCHLTPPTTRTGCSTACLGEQQRKHHISAGPLVGESITGPLCGKSTYQQRNPLTKGQWCWKRPHAKTSSNSILTSTNRTHLAFSTKTIRTYITLINLKIKCQWIENGGYCLWSIVHLFSSNQGLCDFCIGAKLPD